MKGGGDEIHTRGCRERKKDEGEARLSFLERGNDLCEKGKRDGKNRGVIKAKCDGSPDPSHLLVGSGVLTIGERGVAVRHWALRKINPENVFGRKLLVGGGETTWVQGQLTRRAIKKLGFKTSLG